MYPVSVVTVSPRTQPVFVSEVKHGKIFAEAQSTLAVVEVDFKGVQYSFFSLASLFDRFPWLFLSIIHLPHCCKGTQAKLPAYYLHSFYYYDSTHSTAWSPRPQTAHLNNHHFDYHNSSQNNNHNNLLFFLFNPESLLHLTFWLDFRFTFIFSPRCVCLYVPFCVWSNVPGLRLQSWS